MNMFRRFLRSFFTLLGGLIGYELFELVRYLASISDFWEGEVLSVSERVVCAAFFVIIFGVIFYTIYPSINRGSKRIATNISDDLRGVSSTQIIGGAMGLIIGLVIAYLLTLIYGDLITNKTLYLTVNIVIYTLFGFLGGVVGSQKGPEFFNLLVLASSKKNQQKDQQKENREIAVQEGLAYSTKDKKHSRIPKIFDTSAIIDGRILEVMRTGFFEGPIIIPEFVLTELRHIADSSDALKRNKGRRGLDILNQIQDEFGIEIYNTDSEKSIKEIPEVDVKLLKLAQIMKGKVVTNDFNLNKVAAIKGINVLNINELANAIKPVVIPGERMRVTLIKSGKEREQAIGYLDDGTMIVAEEGKRYIGRNVEIIVTTALQTAAGRMIFGKISKD